MNKKSLFSNASPFLITFLLLAVAPHTSSIFVMAQNNTQINKGYDSAYKLTTFGSWVLKKGSKYALADDTTSTTLTPYKYDNIEFIEEGKFILVTINDKVGVVGSDGKEIIPPLYDNITSLLYDNGYSVSKEGKFAMAGHDGTFLTQFIYDGIYYDSDRKAILINQNGKFGIIKDYGKVTIPPIYDNISKMIKGNYIVQKGDKYGYVNSINETVLDFVYSSTEEMNDDVLSKSLPLEYLPLSDFCPRLNIKINDSTLTLYSKTQFDYLFAHDYVILLTTGETWCKPCQSYLKEVIAPIAWNENDYFEFFLVEMAKDNSDNKTKEYLKNESDGMMPTLMFISKYRHIHYLTGKKSVEEVIGFINKCLEEDRALQDEFESNPYYW